MPRNSDWGRALDRIASEWARVTNNQVRLRIQHDGLEGGEAKMLSSLAANNIQAALLTSFGISEICPAVITLSVPFHIANDAEFDLVWREVQPLLDAQFSRTNYAVVTWSKGGWVNIFSREPVFEPDHLRRHRMGTSPEAADMNTVFKAMRFNLVEVDMVDIGPRIASNMINAIYQLPAAVAPLGMHRTLGNMLDLPIAPFMGAIIVNRATWNRLTPQQQRDVSGATQRIAAEFDRTVPRISANAIAMMQRDGLKVNKVTGAQEAQWRSLVDAAMPSLLGTTFDRDIYNRINAILERSRRGR
jgi:TRAP-type C4-dicarboxylate transport system substrate-binding protein